MELAQAQLDAAREQIKAGEEQLVHHQVNIDALIHQRDDMQICICVHHIRKAFKGELTAAVEFANATSQINLGEY